MIEQRVHSDPGADPRLIRISVGVEDLEVLLPVGTDTCDSADDPIQDLKNDLRKAFQEIVKHPKAKL